MKVKSLVTGFDLTEGKVYEVIHAYDTVYELKCDTATYCRPKDFFQVVGDNGEPTVTKFVCRKCDSEVTEITDKEPRKDYRFICPVCGHLFAFEVDEVPATE